MQCAIPAAVVRALCEPAPMASDFKPTKFTPAETKSWFASHFLRFASSDFPKHHFTQRFYGRIMNTFGMIYSVHVRTRKSAGKSTLISTAFRRCEVFGFSRGRSIAHYDSAGFWTEYFTTTAGKVEFIDQVIHHHCFGDPAHTFSDVEREIIRRLRKVDLLGLYRGRSRAEQDVADRAKFARLKARFEPGGVSAQELIARSPTVGRHTQGSTTAAQLSFAIGQASETPCLADPQPGALGRHDANGHELMMWGMRMDG